MKIQDRMNNLGEMCLKCNHARKFHWCVTPYAESVKQGGDYKTVCHWDFEFGQCEQKICGCERSKHDFAIVRS